jgi:hypothetical protein
MLESPFDNAQLSNFAVPSCLFLISSLQVSRYALMAGIIPHTTLSLIMISLFSGITRDWSCTKGPLAATLPRDDAYARTFWIAAMSNFSLDNRWDSHLSLEYWPMPSSFLSSCRSLHEDIAQSFFSAVAYYAYCDAYCAPSSCDHAPYCPPWRLDF